jgi:hypothetical protein
VTEVIRGSSKRVHGLLVTGSFEKTLDWHMAVMLVANGHERRPNVDGMDTVHYTIFDDHLEGALDAAKKLELTVEEIYWEEGAEEESYRLLVGDIGRGWAHQYQGSTRLYDGEFRFQPACTCHWRSSRWETDPGLARRTWREAFDVSLEDHHHGIEKQMEKVTSETGPVGPQKEGAVDGY